MTPFGERLRALRAERGIALIDMARALDVSPTYLSALEHGRRGRPSWGFVQRVIQYFNVIWDDAEALQRLADMSHPRVVVDTAGLSSRATRVANRLSRSIAELSDEDLAALEAVLDKASAAR
ncbi:helix-turn-helix transcriptional regulator [uncultured Alsobacter sp.]|uniref:helix-turn-helix domain-containing protein n=1 Tax=uncultured Alsobacter sp. TaxID=1748258 RepID=UPI0025FF2428|nr:helix-turn-helix transcriptional regulator [uncultured Alsobacter sp.]